MFFFLLLITSTPASWHFGDTKLRRHLLVKVTGGDILMIEQSERLATESLVQGNVARHLICKVNTLAFGWWEAYSQVLEGPRSLTLKSLLVLHRDLPSILALLHATSRSLHSRQLTDILRSNKESVTNTYHHKRILTTVMKLLAIVATVLLLLQQTMAMPPKPDYALRCPDKTWPDKTGNFKRPPYDLTGGKRSLEGENSSSTDLNITMTTYLDDSVSTI